MHLNQNDQIRAPHIVTLTLARLPGNIHALKAIRLRDSTHCNPNLSQAPCCLHSDSIVEVPIQQSVPIHVFSGGRREPL